MPLCQAGGRMALWRPSFSRAEAERKWRIFLVQQMQTRDTQTSPCQVHA